MVGARMDTDVVAALEAGMHSILVLTGSTHREAAESYPYRPSRIVESIADLADELQDDASIERDSARASRHQTSS
jgi:NagD protein